MERATVFGEDAEAYERCRPGYPDGLVDLLVAHGPRDAVDVGCGTGKAARAVADRGVAVLGVEPDARMAAVARRLGTDVEVVPFERWASRPCDLLYAGQAWHWVDPVVGAAKAAESLRPGGRWAAFWNREGGDAVQRTARRVYERVAPQLADDHPAGSDGGLIGRVVDGIDGTGAFTPVAHEEVTWVEVLAAADLVERLMTHSSHRLLDEATAEAVRGGLLEALGGEEATAAVEVRYRTFALVADRR